ncbi:hypothetical protein SBRY_50043 [Actinacidiphila bryophytorum]|uniref:Uncharacterized protein n=1 Tax=Actinacidiphila bryophytorum TaxID=1436133 RepID=A0A9W4H415_9ACTN|nr:hypothetical protein SBRY_50043 [Actinacidiphila bryophytorum]
MTLNATGSGTHPGVRGTARAQPTTGAKARGPPQVAPPSEGAAA